MIGYPHLWKCPDNSCLGKWHFETVAFDCLYDQKYTTYSSSDHHVIQARALLKIQVEKDKPCVIVSWKSDPSFWGVDTKFSDSRSWIRVTHRKSRPVKMNLQINHQVNNQNSINRPFIGRYPYQLIVDDWSPACHYWSHFILPHLRCVCAVPAEKHAGKPTREGGAVDHSPSVTTSPMDFHGSKWFLPGGGWLKRCD